ncbi:hypothetical protein QRO11_15305 [Paracidovorax citrulli]|uniref:hypothetical protein n=1 Tax=Paracidovorax citrulli TaxID=80869 RepID=UPI0008894C11|nr:hypothetical protein [Paracidovorax citrulli]UMT87805.1 hypothetical protein FRC90_06775 [Paracidovorax citrulli]WIY33315.1 hypothetical protein QRO11_15305 [Paracidovorax citrulli]SDK14631.1 hypothetical protein SAMN04489709_1125 [Paracidovorax citrulli]
MGDIINNIWTGRAGLAKTYWGYGFLGGLIWGVVLSMMPQGAPISTVAVLLFVAFLVLVNVGTWRAAALYLGNPLWAVLAKIAVASFPVFILIGTVATVAVTGGRPKPEVPPSGMSAPGTEAPPAVDWEKGELSPPPTR